MQIFLGESLRKVSYRLRAAQLHGQIVNNFHFSCVIFVSLAGGLSFVPCLVCASGSVCLLQDRWKPEKAEKGQCLPASADRCQYRGLSSNPKRRARNFTGCGQGIWGCSMDNEKKPYIFVGLVCVREQYQGQGYARNGQYTHMVDLQTESQRWAIWPNSKTAPRHNKKGHLFKRIGVLFSTWIRQLTVKFKLLSYHC